MSGIEIFRAVLWRSRWFILGAVLTGIAAVNLSAQLEGPVYEARAQVLVSDRDLGAALTGAGGGFVDPERAQETELSLARSAEVIRRTAEASGGRFGEQDVASSTSVSGSTSNDLLTFTATRSDSAKAVVLVNLFVSVYRDWRAEIADAPIRRAIAQIEERIQSSGSTPALEQNLDTLRLLETLNSGNLLTIEEATGASKTSPAPIRDSLIGLAIGLVVGLVSMVARETLNTAVRNASGAEDLLELPVLGSIRSIPRGRRLVTYGPRRAAFEDAYSLLAASIEQRRKNSNESVLVITSPGSGVQRGSNTAAPSTGASYSAVDSSYFATIADVGLIGLAVLVAVLGRIVVLARRATRVAPREGWLAAGLLTVLVVDATTRATFSSFPSAYIGFLLIGLALATAFNARLALTPSGAKRPWDG